MRPSGQGSNDTPATIALGSTWLESAPVKGVLKVFIILFYKARHDQATEVHNQATEGREVHKAK